MNHSVEKGIAGEKKFRDWLDTNNIPFLPIDQKVGLLSKSLKQDFKTKRPDFVVLIPKVGLILVDVKYLNLDLVSNAFSLQDSDIVRYANLEREFNYKVWFAISDNKKDGAWYWISAINTLENCKETKKIFRNSKNGRAYPHMVTLVPISKCIRINSSDSLGVMLSKIIK